MSKNIPTIEVDINLKFKNPLFDFPLLQFREADTWITIKDYNPDSKKRMCFDDKIAREYMDIDMFDVDVSNYPEIKAKLNRGAIIAETDTLKRFRLAVRVFRIHNFQIQHTWIYQDLIFEKDPNEEE